jgi:TetR/AcrR family transcriptional regulator, fatty acid metabolism regulator protein
MNAGSFMKDSDKHQQIIEAAVRVFARNGYYNSRVSDIAREAGVASGTIYLYFKTKDEILVTLFREKMAAWVTHAREELKGQGDPVAKIRRLVALHFSVLERDPSLAEVVQVELRQGHKFFRGAPAQEVSAYFELIGTILQEGQTAGIFRDDVPVNIATKVLFGAMDQMATSWVLGKRKSRLTEAADAVATVFLRGVTVDGL